MRRSVYTVCAALGAVLVMNMTACSQAENGSAGESSAGTQAQTEVQTETQTEEQTEAEVPDLNEVLEEVKGAYGSDYLPDTAVDEAALTETFGIDPGLYEEFAGEVCQAETRVDTFLAVRAVPGEGETVEQLLEAFRDSSLQNAGQDQKSRAKLEASKTVRYGDDVYYVMLGVCDDEMEDEAQLTADYEMQTQIGLDMIDSFYE